MRKFQLSRKGLLMFLFFLSLQLCAQITGQPYLQVLTPNSVVIRWESGTGVIGEVYYGTSDASLTEKITESKDKRIYHVVDITGLLPGTKYYYSVDGSSKAKGDQYFVTAPTIGNQTHVRIWVISDFGQTNSGQNERRLETVAVWKVFNNNNCHADFVLSLGDQTEDDAIYQLQHNYFSQLEEVLKNSPLFTIVGNHDNHDSLYDYLRTFTLPTNGEDGGIPSKTKEYYSFNYANIHVVVLSTEISNKKDQDKQINWLKKDLDSNKQDWLIASMHRPLHSGGYHHSDESDDGAQQRRTDWLKILEDHGVDLVLQGHNHDYERSYLLDNLIGKTTSITDANKINTGNGREDRDGPYIKIKGRPHQGTVFMEVTAGGYANPSNKLEYYSIFPVSYGGLNDEGSVVIDVKGNRMDVKFLCDEKNNNGSNVWDYFTIIKKTD